MGFWEPLPHTPGCSGATCPAHEALGEKSEEWLLWQHQVGSYCRKQRKTAENLKFTALCQGEINLLSYFWMQPSSCHLSGDFPVGAVCTSMLGAAPRWVPVPSHPTHSLQICCWWRWCRTHPCGTGPPLRSSLAAQLRVLGAAETPGLTSGT